MVSLLFTYRRRAYERIRWENLKWNFRNFDEICWDHWGSFDTLLLFIQINLNLWDRSEILRSLMKVWGISWRSLCLLSVTKLTQNPQTQKRFLCKTFLRSVKVLKLPLQYLNKASSSHPDEFSLLHRKHDVVFWPKPFHHNVSILNLPFLRLNPVGIKFSVHSQQISAPPVPRSPYYFFLNSALDFPLKARLRKFSRALLKRNCETAIKKA